MPTGFQNRYKGKNAFPIGGIWIGGVQVNASGADINTVVGSGTTAGVAYTTAGTQTIAGAGGVATIAASSGIAIFALGASPILGVEKTIQIIQNSTKVFLKAAAGTSFDPSTNTVIASTLTPTLTLIGVSSLRWAIKGTFPPTTVQYVLSTTT